MRGFHPATWVVLKLRCASVLCLMVSPELHSQRGRHYSFGSSLMTHGGEPLLLRDDTTTGMVHSTFPPRTTITTAGASLRENREDDATSIDHVGRLRQMSGKAWDMATSFLECSRSLVTSVLPFRKTELESAFQQQDKQDSSTVTVSTSCLDNDTISTTTDASVLPDGPRWAIAHPDTDFSGVWVPVVDSPFKDQYGDYMEKSGRSFLFRQVCLNFASTTREEIQQEDQGRVLHFVGQSPAGGWKRSLVSSGADSTTHEFEPVHAEFLDPDSELVKVEAWWEDDGTVHKSWLRDKAGVDGGQFESTRYLEDAPNDGKFLICESAFHPSEKHLQNPSSKFKPAFVRWRYRRES
ncbi:expressed unknown protein [Seminavis robusta]|uniref:Uncharacterized protein n=1 Tax=Seminavis robusta TaxID=568900 RepID=A0A9N8F1W7_9STRA|nr:expressed unknown protein [Seminavis robusta]|eukprot:Sro2338_g323940.1 n/a (352) ;mRNA; r:11761-12816